MFLLRVPVRRLMAKVSFLGFTLNPIDPKLKA